MASNGSSLELKTSDKVIRKRIDVIKTKRLKLQSTLRTLKARVTEYNTKIQLLKRELGHNDCELVEAIESLSRPKSRDIKLKESLSKRKGEPMDVDTDSSLDDE